MPVLFYFSFKLNKFAAFKSLTKKEIIECEMKKIFIELVVCFQCSKT